MSLSPDSVALFILFVVPGLVTITVYRILMPARSLEWSTAIVQGLFFSSINFVILLPLALGLLGRSGTGDLASLDWSAVWWRAIVVLLVFPSIWAFIAQGIFESGWYRRRNQIPYPTAWDDFFNRWERFFALVHLNSGRLLGAYWGWNSYAGSFPNNGDIYFEAVYSISESGEFLRPVANTKGVLLRREDYVCLELFDVPIVTTTQGVES